MTGLEIELLNKKIEDRNVRGSVTWGYCCYFVVDSVSIVCQKVEVGRGYPLCNFSNRANKLFPWDLFTSIDQKGEVGHGLDTILHIYDSYGDIFYIRKEWQ